MWLIQWLDGLTLSTAWCTDGSNSTRRFRVRSCSLRSPISAMHANAGRYSFVRSGTGSCLMNILRREHASDAFMFLNENSPWLNLLSISCLRHCNRAELPGTRSSPSSSRQLFSMYDIICTQEREEQTIFITNTWAICTYTFTYLCMRRRERNKQFCYLNILCWSQN